MKIHPQWRQHVSAWRQSGLSQAAYCRQQTLNDKTFSRWVRHALSVDQAPTPSLIPIRLSPQISQSPLLLRLEHGACLELSTTVSPPWLAELLKCLA